jgi:mono/diheme cytochrome c family protein
MKPAIVVTLLLGTAWAVLAAQVPAPAKVPWTEESTTGPDTYTFYCAPCHGRTGKGDGPVASALKTPPPDLTTLAVRRGGRFPRAEVTTFVAGRRRMPPAHGSSDMPVWGPAFRALEDPDSRISVRLLNVVEYLESIQVKR